MSLCECQVNYELLVPSGRLFVGSGTGTALVDRTFLRDAAGRPFVPASQVKGVVRHEAEKLMAALGRPVPGPHEPSSADQDLGLVGRTFGLPGGRDMTCRFSDAVLPVQDDREPSWTSQVRRMVHLSRLTRRPVSRHLYDTEYAILGLAGEKPRLQGSVTLWAEAPDSGAIPPELTLLCAALRLVRGLGGDKTTGAGLVSVEITEILVAGRRVPLEQVLQPLEDPAWPASAVA